MASRRAERHSLPAPHNDAGLQPERTSLAWGRTLLGLLVVACTFLRWLHTRGEWSTVLALFSLFAALYIGLTQRRRYRRSARAIHTGRLRADVVSVLFTGLVVVCLAGMSIWAVLGGA